MKYQVENLKKEKEKMLAQYKAFKKAWESVTFPTKKDGTPFKNLSKNFSGARYYIGAYSITNCNYMLDVYTSVNYKNAGTEYISDSIYCSENLKYVKNVKIKPENIRKQGTYVEDQYLYDLEEIRNILIPKRIGYYEKMIKKIEDELSQFGSIVAAVDIKIAEMNTYGDLFMEILKKSL